MLLMRGNPRAVQRGWFSYPFNFDPIWCLVSCANFEAMEKTNNE